MSANGPGHRHFATLWQSYRRKLHPSIFLGLLFDSCANDLRGFSIAKDASMLYPPETELQGFPDFFVKRAGEIE